MPRRRGESKTSARQVNARLNEMKALDLRRQGLSYVKIGEALNMSDVGARKAVLRVLERMATEVTEAANEVKQLELQRLDDATEAIYPDVEKGDPRAIETLLRIQQRRSALLGLDSPKKLDVDGTIGIRQYVGVDVEKV